jgi:hypothetical protein
MLCQTLIAAVGWTILTTTDFKKIFLLWVEAFATLFTEK